MKNTDQQQFYINAADNFINSAGKPRAFIEFIIEALSTLKAYDTEEAAHLLFSNLLTDIILPWAFGNDNNIETVSAGLKNFAEFRGYKEFADAMGKLFLYFGKDLNESLIEPEIVSDWLFWLTIINQIGCVVKAAELIKHGVNPVN